jgi:hypothetical protein
MRRRSHIAGWIALAAMLVLAAPAANAIEAPERELIRSVLEATATAGPNAVPVEGEVERIAAEIDAIVEKLGTGKPTYKRARRLHQLLHREYLRSYDRDADMLSLIMDDGSFNCLSASLMYGAIARSLGFKAYALSEPGHLLIRLEVGTRVVDVETTLPGGFDARRARKHSGNRSPRQADTSVGAAGSGASSAGREMLSMPLEAAVGFAWLNRSWHDLDRGAPVEAAQGIREALRRLPPAVDQVDGARLLMARAFSLEYDAGRFDNAFDIAAIDAALFPDKTTTRDRLVAAAIKQIEFRCERDEPERALGIIDAVKAAGADSPETVRLERRTYPGIAAAAVRLQDWNLAREISGRYDVAQPDRTESARLREWVETRQAPGKSGRASEATSRDTPPVLIY